MTLSACVDRRIALEHTVDPLARVGIDRFYRCTRMQARVARRMPRIVVVSENSIQDIHDDMGVDLDRMRLVHVGVDPQLFRPLPNVRPVPRRLITTASADVELKGLRFLLEAMADLRAGDYRDVSLTVIGPPEVGERLGFESA